MYIIWKEQGLGPVQSDHCMRGARMSSVQAQGCDCMCGGFFLIELLCAIGNVEGVKVVSEFEHRIVEAHSSSI